ncbi:hypothetical protein [Streptosporangium sp. NPDC000239]|uniref:hypothetical protein n=1 Tax=unclassified Streptosporangium TaxID=2632669 RepID=UPI00331E2D05
MSSRLIGLGIAAFIAASSLATPASASPVHTTAIKMVNAPLNAECTRQTDVSTYAQVSCTGTSLSYRVEAQYCRPGSCSWHNGVWVSGGAWSTLSGFSGGAFDPIQVRFA